MELGLVIGKWNEDPAAIEDLRVVDPRTRNAGNKTKQLDKIWRSPTNLATNQLGNGAQSYHRRIGCGRVAAELDVENTPVASVPSYCATATYDELPRSSL
jgi:hypothetical protein